MKKVLALVMALLMVLSLVACGSSSSKTKWSDLSKEEQDNARWAYEAKQAEENYKK